MCACMSVCPHVCLYECMPACVSVVRRGHIPRTRAPMPMSCHDDGNRTDLWKSSWCSKLWSQLSSLLLLNYLFSSNVFCFVLSVEKIMYINIGRIGELSMYFYTQWIDRSKVSRALLILEFFRSHI